MAEEATEAGGAKGGEEGVTFRTPNEMFEASKEIELGGREPATSEDWQRLANFWAFNTCDGMEVPVTKLMCLLFCRHVISPDMAERIAVFQNRSKAGRN